MQKATFGAGCFWGVETAFRQVNGVLSTAVGYSGGHVKNPTYEQVCTDATGHAEVVEVEFDPQVVTYKQLLDVFWECHDPTQRNRQGPDFGSQYRTVIFYHNPEQRAAANESKDALDMAHPDQAPGFVTQTYGGYGMASATPGAEATFSQWDWGNYDPAHAFRIFPTTFNLDLNDTPIAGSASPDTKTPPMESLDDLASMLDAIADFIQATGILTLDLTWLNNN